MGIDKYLNLYRLLFLLICFLSFLSCDDKFDYSSLKSYECVECKHYFDSKFELTYESFPLITRGNEVAIDGSNWNKLAEKKFGKASKIKMCREGNYKEFKKHLYCYIGLDYEKMIKLFPKGVIKKQKMTDSTKSFNIEIEVGKALNYPEITWQGTWEKQFFFKKTENEFQFLGDAKENETLKICLNSN